MNGAPPTRSMILDSMATIIDTVRQHATEVNRKWGYNRLPHIVPIEWAERFRSQKAKFEDACFECTEATGAGDIEAVKRHGEAMIRAYGKLEEIALAAGHSPAPPEVWSFELDDGTPVALVRTRAELAQVDHRPGTQLWCLEEIGKIVTKFPDLVAVKHAFPNAEVIQMGPSKEARDAVLAGSDEIPF